MKYPYKYTSKEFDPETNLYYYGHRYLDPKLSQWNSVDPPLISGEYLPKPSDFDTDHNYLWHNSHDETHKLPGMGGVFNPVNMNAYHYAGNNPVILIDPDGKDVINNTTGYLLILDQDGKSRWLPPGQTHEGGADFIIAPNGTVRKITESDILAKMGVTVDIIVDTAQTRDGSTTVYTFDYANKKSEFLEQKGDKRKEERGDRSDFSGIYSIFEDRNFIKKIVRPLLEEQENNKEGLPTNSSDFREWFHGHSGKD